MSDLFTLPEQPWKPSRALHDRLWYGAVAVVVAGALSASGSVVSLLRGPVPGFTLSEILALLALLPLAGVLRTYWALSQEVGSLGLRKGVLGVYGVTGLTQLLTLVDEDVAAGWVQVVAWVLMGVGAVALIVVVVTLEAPAEKPEAKEAETPEPVAADGTDGDAEMPASPKPAAADGTADKPEDSATKKAGAGCGGGAVAAAVLAKLAARGVRLGAQPWLIPLLQVLVLLVLLGSGACYLIGFAVAKIRASGKLGSLAVALGILELLLVLAFVGGIVWVVAGLVGLPEQPAARAAALDDLTTRAQHALAVGSLAADVSWALLTVLFFLGLRGGYDPDFDDAVTAEAD
jgi:hypothetical protein